MGYLVSAFFIALYYSTFVFGISQAGFFKKIKTYSKGIVITIALATGLFLLLIIGIMRKENFVYFWDYGSYWYMTLDFAKNLFSNTKNAINQLYTSINYNDYNLLPCMLVSLPLKIFGNSYFSFVILNTIMFYIPNAFILAFAFQSIIERFYSFNVKISNIYLYTLTFTIMLFPVLNGYIDVIGMLPLSTSFLLIIDRDFKKMEPIKDIALGLSILWVILLRRYFAYAVVGLAVFAFLYWISYSKDRLSPLLDLKTKIIDMLISLIIPVFAVLLFFRKYLIASLFNNHLSAYSSYKTTSTLGEFLYLKDYFGYLFIILAVLGIVLNLKFKIRKFTLSLVMGLLITCILFFRIQNMDLHHYYTIALPMSCLILMGFCGAFEYFSNTKIICKALVILMVFICSLNFTCSFNFTIKKSIPNKMTLSKTYVPRKRYDINVLKKMEKYLGELSENGHHGVYILASSNTFNNDVMYKLNAPDLNPPYECLSVSHIDLRDGFDTNFFKADVVIACMPVQKHQYTGQHVIVDLNNIMLTENEFSDNYKLEKTFTIDKGIKVLIYVKEKALSTTEVNFIEKVFDNIYPDYPKLFRDRIQEYKLSIS